MVVKTQLVMKSERELAENGLLPSYILVFVEIDN